MVSTQSLGDFSTSNKRGLRKQHSFKNKADSKVFNSQSDEGRELARREIPQNSRNIKRVKSIYTGFNSYVAVR